MGKWDTEINATQLTSITTEQLFVFAGSSTIEMVPGKAYHFQIKSNPPTTPTDHLIVACYFATQDTPTFDLTSPLEFLIDKAKDPNRTSFTLLGNDFRKVQIGVRRSGTTDTYTDADASYTIGIADKVTDLDAGAGSDPVPVVAIGDVINSGSLTAAATSVTLDANTGVGTVAVDVSGTWSGTLQFEGSVNGSTWLGVNAAPVPSGALVTSTTANGNWQINAAGYKAVRVRCSTYSSGTIVIAVRGSLADAVIGLSQPLPVGDNNIGNVDVLTVPSPLSSAGGGTEAAALRVTLANDSTGVVSIDDNGGSLTVDAPVGTPVATRLSDGTAFLTTTGGKLSVDPSGADVTTVGKAADGAAVSGNPVLMAGQDGTNVQSLKTDTSGELQVDVLTLPSVTIGTNAALVAGSANIGDVDILSIAAGDTNIGNVDIVTMPTAVVTGDVAHDGVNSGNPEQLGGHAVSGSASPTSVAAADRVRWIFNQHGMPYTIAGHPNLITREFDFGTAAQTDLNLAAAVVAADERIYVTRFEALCDNANTVAVAVRCGFGATAVPTASATGVSGMIASHPGIPAGSGIICGSGAGLIAVGGAGEEPRLTTSVATTGNLHVVISYFLIDETP